MTTDEEVIRRIDDLLQDIRPNIQMDGGDVELVSYRNGIVSLKLSGSCTTCFSFRDHVRSLVEERLKDSIAEVHEVIILIYSPGMSSGESFLG